MKFAFEVKYCFICVKGISFALLKDKTAINNFKAYYHV